MILLDTHALIWLDQGHRRTRSLSRERRRLYVSPATLLELQFLQESGRIRVRDAFVGSLADDERWSVDEPPAARWFLAAADFSWTRDPFDRLLAAHAQLRGWRLATAEGPVLEHLGPQRSLEI